MTRDEYHTLMDHIANFTEVIQDQFQEKDWPDEPVPLPTGPQTYVMQGLTAPMAFLARQPSTEQGTFGNLQCCLWDRHAEFATLELPWLANRRDLSCIPAGNYVCHHEHTSKNIGGNEWWYHVLDVPSRGNILIHPGNWAGDEGQGYYSDSRGCILLGLKETKLRPPLPIGDADGSPVPNVVGGQMAIGQSRKACSELAQFFGRMDFELRVYDA